MAAIPPPRPEGKILIFKISATAETNLLEEVDRRVLALTLEACVKVSCDQLKARVGYLIVYNITCAAGLWSTYIPFSGLRTKYGESSVLVEDYRVYKSGILLLDEQYHQMNGIVVGASSFLISIAKYHENAVNYTLL